MDLSVLYLAPDNEMPLDNLTTDGGFCGIFRTNACIGDSLSSGEFEPCDKSGNLEFGDIETDININDYKNNNMKTFVGNYAAILQRYNMEDFKQIGFVGTDFHNVNFEW